MPVFKKGEPRHPESGRRAGTPNKVTAEMKEILEAAVREMGGLKRLVAWAKSSDEREDMFWSSMAMKLLPLQVKGTGEGGALVVRIEGEDLQKELEARGLPPLPELKHNMPLLELKANGKGRDQ